MNAFMYENVQKYLSPSNATIKIAMRYFIYFCITMNIQMFIPHTNKNTIYVCLYVYVCIYISMCLIIDTYISLVVCLFSLSRKQHPQGIYIFTIACGPQYANLI